MFSLSLSLSLFLSLIYIIPYTLANKLMIMRYYKTLTGRYYYPFKLRSRQLILDKRIFSRRYEFQILK